ncbi:hypothetical protein [uncultured Thiohalocapsa sp.]|uniref:hypothetical protein n=1 Tax=uncultured Thiohalocapsa sp. TaxID=768990 RepID=UPI0025D1E5B3|nr:hypothetical protein [uncultured Thiohalocapsa sp.]
MPEYPSVDPNAVGRFLETCLKARRTAYYAEVVKRFGLPALDGAWASHPLSEIFDVLDREDAAAPRPYRTAVVIAQDTNRPGNGFFEALQRYKNIPDPGTLEGRDSVWIAELNAAYDFLW